MPNNEGTDVLGLRDMDDFVNNNHSTEQVIEGFGKFMSLSSPLEYIDKGIEEFDPETSGTMTENEKDHTVLLNIASLECTGLSKKEVARQLDMSVHSIGQYMRKPSYKEVKNMLTNSVVDKVKDMVSMLTFRAVEAMGEGLYSSNEKTKLKAASEILNRAGINKAQEINVTATNGNAQVLTEAQLANLMGINPNSDIARAIEMKGDTANVNEPVGDNGEE